MLFYILFDLNFEGLILLHLQFQDEVPKILNLLNPVKKRPIVYQKLINSYKQLYVTLQVLIIF